LIDSSLIGALAQRLVRKICSYCKEEVVIPPEVLESCKVPESFTKDKKFKAYRGKGCARCNGTGYSGRVAIAEVLLSSAAVRELILARAQEHQIKKQARMEGMVTLRESGLQLVVAGITSMEEVLRVTAPDEE
jgi:type IV pilus assembly protein PilB